MNFFFPPRFLASHLLYSFFSYLGLILPFLSLRLSLAPTSLINSRLISRYSPASLFSQQRMEMFFPLPSPLSKVVFSILFIAELDPQNSFFFLTFRLDWSFSILEDWSTLFSLEVAIWIRGMFHRSTGSRNKQLVFKKRSEWKFIDFFYRSRYFEIEMQASNMHEYNVFMHWSDWKWITKN